MMICSMPEGEELILTNGLLWRHLLQETHDLQWVGHPGIERMLALLFHRYNWPKMEEDVETYVKTCLLCQLDKLGKKTKAGLS